MYFSEDVPQAFLAPATVLATRIDALQNIWVRSQGVGEGCAGLLGEGPHSTRTEASVTRRVDLTKHVGQCLM